VNVEYAGGDNIRLTIPGIEAAASGNLVSVKLSREAALRLADKINATSETMRRMAALLRAEQAAGEVS
jgi:hypothetical protein